jgi:hypothetical protein
VGLRAVRSTKATFEKGKDNTKSNSFNVRFIGPLVDKCDCADVLPLDRMFAGTHHPCAALDIAERPSDRLHCL